jgi:hypothetical protein
MTEERFKQIWDAATGGPDAEKNVSDCEANGMSDKLAEAINTAENNGKCLVLTDWTTADY